MSKLLCFKKTIAIGLVVCLSLVLTGCSEFLKSPMEMIRRPRLEVNQQRALEVIQQAISPSAKLISPLISDELSSVNMVDIDRDDVKEVVAFYSMKEAFRIGVIILERSDDGFFVIYQHEAIGNDLIYARLDDLSGLGRHSLVLGLQGAEGTLKNLSIFTFRNETYIESYRSEYSELIVDDFDGDKRNELFVLSYNRDQPTTATVLKEHLGIINVMDIVPLDPSVKSYSFIQFGQVARGRNAIFLDFNLGSTLAATEILLFDKLRMKNIFYNRNDLLKYEHTLKSELIRSQDIDGDKVIEIGKPLNPPATRDPITHEVSKLSGWYKWDGQEGLNLFKITYDDPDGDYRFTLPSRWKMDVSVYNNLDLSNLKRVRFRIELESDLTFNLLEIVTVPQVAYTPFIESLEARGSTYYILGSQGEFTYVALVDTVNRDIPKDYLDQYRNLTVTETEIKYNFLLLKP